MSREKFWKAKFHITFRNSNKPINSSTESPVMLVESILKVELSKSKGISEHK